MTQPLLEFALNLEQVETLLFHIGSLALEHLVQTLRLKTSASHREVDERDTWANIGRKLAARVARRQEHGEHGAEVDVLVSEGDEHTTASAADLTVEHWIKNRVVVFDVLNQDGVTKSKSTFKILAESYNLNKIKR